MDGEKLRRTLTDPLLLNFVAMMFAVDRTYQLFLANWKAWVMKVPP